MFTSRTLVVCCLLAGLLACPAAGHAATRYVAPAGNAGNSGSAAASPWTLAKAVTESAPGDTVLMAGGSYPKVVAANAARTGVVTFRAEGPSVPTVAGMQLTGVDGVRFEGVTFTARVTGLGHTGDWQFVGCTWSLRGGIALANFVSSKDSLATRGVFEGLRIDNGRFVAPAGAPATDGLALLTASTPHRDLVIEDTLFRTLGGNGLKFHRVQGLRADGNAFDRVMNAAGTTNHSAAVQVVGPSDDVKVRRNFVNGGRGVIVQPDLTSGTGATTRLEVQANVFSGRQFGGRFVATPGARIVGNTFWSTSGDGTSSLDLFHHGSAAGGKRPGEATTGVVLKNNLIRRIDVVNNFGKVTFADQAGNLIKVDDRDRPAAAGTIVGVAPAFRAFTAGPAASDMHLSPGQPAGIVDGGSWGDGVEREDCDGIERRGAPDLGALEAGPVTPGTGCIWQRRHPGG